MTMVMTMMVAVMLFCPLDMLAIEHKKTALNPGHPGFAQDHTTGKLQSQKLFNLYNNSVPWVLFLSPFYR